jgi:hypothetical protein
MFCAIPNAQRAEAVCLWLEFEINNSLGIKVIGDRAKQI